MSNEKSVIRNCSLGYACTCQWDDLKILKYDDVRFCNTCQKEVYDCQSIEDLAESILLNRNIHIGEDIFDQVENSSLTPLSYQNREGGLPQSSYSNPTRSPVQGFDDFDDDIPF